MDNFTLTPTSLADVERFIVALYDPRTPREQIPQIQTTLQGIQKSNDGWQLARALLDRPGQSDSDRHLKFFGALTTIVKLNTDSSALSDEEALEVLNHLLGWIVAETPSTGLVASKLCHALCVFYIHFSHIFPDCARLLLCCLHAGRVVSLAEKDNGYRNTAMILAELSTDRLHMVIRFLEDLVTEVGKTDANSQQHAETHKRLLKNNKDVEQIFHTCLLPQPLRDMAPLGVPIFHVIGLWINYAQCHASNADEIVTMLRDVAMRVIELLPENIDDSVIELCSDTLTNYSSFFQERHYELFQRVFQTPWAGEMYSRLFRPQSDPEHVKFGLLMLAFGDARVQQLMESTEESSQKFLFSLCQLLNAHGDIVAEDEIFVPALEFWSTFVETMTDSVYSEPDPDIPWKAHSLSLITEVVNHCSSKIKYSDSFKDWDSDERTGFSEARKDVADLLQAIFTLSGMRLVRFFADNIVEWLEKPRGLAPVGWPYIEAMVYCLASLSDCAAESTQDEFDPLLEKVFSSSLFSDIQKPYYGVTSHLRPTTLMLIDRYADYFHRHPTFLDQALSFLFNALDVKDATGHRSYEAASSKAILTLCRTCRLNLANNAAGWSGNFSSFHDKIDIEPVAEERILTAVASIVQAVKSEATRLEIFGHLLEEIQKDADIARQILLTNGDVHGTAAAKAIHQFSLNGTQANKRQVCEAMTEFSMRLLVSLAKGMQEPSDIWDLDAKEEQSLQISPQLAAIHERIWAFISRTHEDFPQNARIVESICDILKAGFSESQPGPFVFAPGHVTQFLLLRGLHTPKIGAVLSTACAFSSSLAHYPLPERSETAAHLMTWVIGLLRSMPSSNHDTEISQNGIEFALRVLNRMPAVVFYRLSKEDAEFMFLFTLNVLDGKEPLPKQAAAEFWTGFLSLNTDDSTLQSHINDAATHLGPLLALSIARNIGGNAARSELDKISEPLRKLVSLKPQASAWLEAALTDASFPSEIVGDKEKREFLAKIVRLRGGRQQTNQIVRDFWMKCRGSSFAFTS